MAVALVTDVRPCSTGRTYTSEHHIELTRPDGAGVQVSLFERELAVTVVYWHTGQVARAMTPVLTTPLAITSMGRDRDHPPLLSPATRPDSCRVEP